MRTAKKKWESNDPDSPLVYLGVVVEVVAFIVGLTATNLVWGSNWGVVVFIVYVIGLVLKWRYIRLT